VAEPAPSGDVIDFPLLPLMHEQEGQPWLL